MQAAPRVGDATAAQKLEDAQQRYQSHKEKFERLRSDVSVKMKFLDENRVIRLSLLAVTCCWGSMTFDQAQHSGFKKKVFPSSLPSVGPGVDPAVQAVSPQVTKPSTRR